ncbi:MAG: N-acetyltransferase family protein [Pseudomonadota bacterium]
MSRAGGGASHAKLSTAEPQDYAAIAAIWNDVIRNTSLTFTTAEKTEADIAALECVMVARIEAEVLAFAAYFPFRGGPGYARTAEISIYVKPDRHGAGIGLALLSALEGRAKESGKHVLIAGINTENANGRGFFERAGYQEMGTLSEVGHKNGRFLSLTLAQKTLR